MIIVQGSSFDLIRKMSLTSAEVATFLKGFLRMLPDKLDDNNRQLLREGLGKLLSIGVKESISQIDFQHLLEVLNKVDPASLKIKYATQRQVPAQVTKDMAVISGRWDTLTRRTKVANALVMYRRTNEINSAELARRLEIQSPGYLSYLVSLRRSVTSKDIGQRIETLIGLPMVDFVSPSLGGGYRNNRPTKDQLANILGSKKIRQLVKALQGLDENEIDAIRAIVKTMGSKKLH